MSEKPLRVIFQGGVPLPLLNSTMEGFLKHCPEALMLDYQHPLCRKHGATMVLCRRDDAFLDLMEEPKGGETGNG